MLMVVDRREGFGPEFGKLVSMMDYARFTTLGEVKNLTIEELDYLFDEEANSIGMLLAHFAAVERVYQIVTFENRDPSEEELEPLLPGLDLGTRGRETFKGYPLEFYLKELADVRTATLEKFKTLPDEWLYERTPFWWNKPANNFFKWFHVFEDELNHRGQIRIIKKMIKRGELTTTNS
ncbi:DinB family protein [Bacillus sp. FJAT-29814]|uniref:DinB family protein n=1 Tax=Bacillus sp. FJAT-29814 TaxID=1729688 RepID=UPI0012E34ABE|nr:DUF664 domain-containing protein [Bacillus sp. FJAT-29814]